MSPSRDSAFFYQLKGALLTIFTFLVVSLFAPTVDAQSVTPSEEEVVFYTEEWEGERYDSGRPKVSDEILERMENISIEMAWGTLREHGYHNQFEGGWKKIKEDEAVVGRALTAEYMPSSPGLEERLTENGRENGFEGPPNTWPIQMLKQGDVYVADGFGKIKDGTLIGDRLGTDIYSNSGNGVVIDGSLRDLSGLEEIEGFNAFVRDWHPSFIQEMMLSEINTPIRVGKATVLPGDVVLAKREGVLFIPAHFAKEAVREAELTILTDTFAHQRTREGIYNSGQLDTEWTEEIKSDFYSWLENNKADFEVPSDRVQEIIDNEPL
jgi:regulator of RNase E activity RraA